MSVPADADAASSAQYKKKWSRPSCLECRKSKRRCDSLLPHCSRCQNLGLDCEYKLAADTKTDTLDSLSGSVGKPAEQESIGEDVERDAGVVWISSTLLLDSVAVRCLLLQGMRAIDWPEWLSSQNNTQLEQTIFKLHDPELPVISLLQMIVLIKGLSASFPVSKLNVASCVRVCNSLLQSIETEIRSLPSRISARMSSKNRSFEMAACLVPWMTVLLTESGILGDALSSLHSRLLRLSSTVVCFFFSKPADSKDQLPPNISAKRSREAPARTDEEGGGYFVSNPFTVLTNALSRPWDVLSRMVNAAASQASDLICTSDHYRLAVSRFTAPTVSEGLLPTDSNTSSLTHSDLDHIYMQVSASSDIDDASKCWYQIFVDCAKYLLCFRNSQHERAQAHIADAAKAISLLKATNLSSVPSQIVPCFKGVVACCLSRISELGPAVSPLSFARPVIIGAGVAAEVHAKQLSPILLGHVARIIGCVASVVATNSTQTTLISNQAASLRSCSLLQLKPILCASESPPRRPSCSSGNHSDDDARSPVNYFGLPLSTSPHLRCLSPSSAIHACDWELPFSGRADDAMEVVNNYLAEDIFDCSSAAGVAAAEGGSFISSWWGAAAAAVSSTVASAAAQPIVEGNVLNFLSD